MVTQKTRQFCCKFQTLETTPSCLLFITACLALHPQEEKMSCSWSGVISSVTKFILVFLCVQFEDLNLLVSGKIIKRTWPISTYLEKISLVVNVIDYHNGWILKWARWNESWVLIGYASEQDGPILPAQDFPHQFCREKFSSVAI